MTTYCIIVALYLVLGFEKCASLSIGVLPSCTICHNGGIYVSSSVLPYCICATGSIGHCCRQIVTCGEPSSINHGFFSGTTFTYNSQVTYYCDNDYNMTDVSDSVRTCTEYGTWSGPLPVCMTVTCGEPSPINHGTFTGTTFTYNSRVTYYCDNDYNMTDVSEPVRTCTEHGTWSGRSPVCMFAKSCSSDPCRNKASCVNMLGDFKCVCQEGWAGKTCDSDIQPIVVTGCPTDRIVLTSNMTSNQTWNEPSMKDPHGTNVQVTRNYPTNAYDFPWGEFTVQYSAVKPSNGLTAECVFSVVVKPHPCQRLVAPEHGMVLCNNWRTDYARVCTYSCLKGFTLPPGFTGTMFNCGASGNWLPSSHLEKCYPDVFDINDEKESNDEIQAFETCDKLDDRANIAKFYINTLKSSEFNSLCLNHIDKCSYENVDIKCMH